MGRALSHTFLSLSLLYASVIAGVPSPESLNSSITILITNDLQGIESPSANSGLIILDPRSYSSASRSCQALGEQLWSPELGISGIQTNLNYLGYTKYYEELPGFWIGPDHVTGQTLDIHGNVSRPSEVLELPVLCTQSAPFSSDTSQDNSKKWHVKVRSNNEYITGFRDRLSFRFLGVRYAAQPKRFAYPQLYVGNNSDVSATQYGSMCIQGGTGSEDCHFLNIWTTFLPGPTFMQRALKPVMVCPNLGGAFTGGTANDKDFDGGNLASRSDVVVVAVNYRLGTFGFLALEDGVTNGNFGLADQIMALDWVRKNIHKFGGDPKRIIIFGQSAGAASVRAMIASPKAIGKFAAAIPLSNLGGINYGTSYSKYMTIGEELKTVGDAILASTNCTDAVSQVDCLRSIPTSQLSRLDIVASSLVVDGTYLVSDELELEGPRLPVHLMIGTTRDDGAAFIGYPTTTNQSAYLASLGFDVPSAKLFPVPDIENQTLALFNMTARLATDGIFRCIDQATTYAALFNDRLGSVYYYEFNRTYQLTNYPQLDVCEPPKSISHPFGDPTGEYFKCHSGELYYLFGNLAREGLPMRDDHDLPFQQFIVDSFSSFARTYDPNPDLAYLRARGYTNTSREIEQYGIWKSATKHHLTKRTLQWPSSQSPFIELQQCGELGLPLSYYNIMYSS
ncbi:Alpha/Beta hydrolase protein [Xylaria acuta]|nr:Alpha/Beta hydrolase protein [Xylaria acuta]